MVRSGVIRCLVAAALFGASAPAASRLAGEMPTLVLAGLLYVGAGLAVVPAVVRRPPSSGALGREWRRVTVAVVAGGAIGPALLVAGLARTTAATASILLNLELAATVALAALVFHEHLGRRVVIGAAVVTAAGLVLVWEPGLGLSAGALLIAAACVAWGFDNGVTARIDQLAPEHVVLAKGAVAGVANLALGLALTDGAGAVTAGQVAVALVIGAGGYGLSITLWVTGARELGAARGQIIFATAPFIGAVVAWVVLGEAATVAQGIALALAAIGVGIALDSAHEHRHSHDLVEHNHEHRHDDGHHGHLHDPMPVGRHSHPHRHDPVEHVHPHLPDLHHRHAHARAARRPRRSAAPRDESAGR